MTESHPPMPRGLKRYPASARLVWARLDQHGPLTRPELMAWTLLPERTLDDQLATLREDGWVESAVAPCDGCQYRYRAFRQPRDSRSSES